MPRPVTLAILAAAVLAAAASSAQQPAAPAAGTAAAPATPAPAQAPPQFGATADVVALDVVVRDKKGRLVTDLQPGELTVLEDGVPQKITSFRAIQGASPASPAAGATPATAAPAASAAPAVGAAAAGGARAVVMVFGRLGSEGRRLAQGAGEEFAKKHVGPGTVVSVVRIDGTLVPLAERTSDPEALKEAVRRATARIVDGGARAGGPTGADSSFAGQQMGRFEGGAGVRSLSQADSVAFLNGLVGIVDALQAEPGRKTVLLFCEGLLVPPGYEQVLADLKSRANRGNVAIYGLDVRGLQLATQLGSSGASLAAATAISEQQRNSGAGRAANREEMTQDDVMQMSLRSDVVDTLSQLSSSTGGFLVSQTNDFSRALARIAEDLRGYYELSYVPSAPPAPGQFRRTEVQVARRDLHVQSRAGYFGSAAVAPPPEAFAPLESGSLPADFEVRSAFYHFGRARDGQAFDCLVKLETSLSGVEFKPDAAGRLSGKLAFAGRVRDASGQTVESFGQEVALGGSDQQVSAARGQVFPLARRLALAPGSYTVEVVVRDPQSQKASAQRMPIAVPAAEGDLAMSSLVVVAAVDPADPKSDPTDPLRLGEQRIVPNLGTPVARAAGAVLPVYYNVYVPPGTTNAVAATVEVQRDGRLVARGSSPLPAADATGRITGLSPIPLQKLTGGTYQVKVSVTSGALSVAETTAVTIAP